MYFTCTKTVVYNHYQAPCNLDVFVAIFLEKFKKVALANGSVSHKCAIIKLRLSVFFVDC